MAQLFNVSVASLTIPPPPLGALNILPFRTVRLEMMTVGVLPGKNMKHAAARVAVHCETEGAGTIDCKILGYRQLTARERDHARHGKVDRVAIYCVGKRLAERAWAAVIRVGDSDSGLRRLNGG